MPAIRYEFNEYKGLDKTLTDPLWDTVVSRGDTLICSHDYDPIIYTSAKPNFKDEKGNVVEATICDKCTSYTEKFAYDQENNCIERTQFDAQGNLVFKSGLYLCL